MKESYYDQLLNIKTAEEQKGFHKSLHYHRYEPTPYSALEELFREYELSSSDHVVDFGCGKGRLNFFINHLFNAEITGVEMNEGFYQEALENRNHYGEKYRSRQERVNFQCCLAEEYQISPLENRFYFFNPFSIQVFMKVVNNILRSVETSWRQVELVLYYPSEDYIYFLDHQTSFELTKEIPLRTVKQNQNERFLIYRLNY